MRVADRPAVQLRGHAAQHRCEPLGRGEADAALPGVRQPQARFGGHRRPILEPHEALVRSILDTKSDISLCESGPKLHGHGVVVGATSTIGRFLRRTGLTRKKRA